MKNMQLYEKILSTVFPVTIILSVMPIRSVNRKSYILVWRLNFMITENLEQVKKNIRDACLAAGA